MVVKRGRCESILGLKRFDVLGLAEIFRKEEKVSVTG